jgi:hypothetical protein
MNMGAAGPLEHPGDKDFVVFKESAADRAGTFPIAPDAVDAAPYVHKPVLSPGNRRKG